MHCHATMTHNESSLDRIIRLVVGVALLSLVFVGPKTLLGLIGLIPLATAAIGYCPLYALFGISSCHRREHRHA